MRNKTGLKSTFPDLALFLTLDLLPLSSLQWVSLSWAMRVAITSLSMSAAALSSRRSPSPFSSIPLIGDSSPQTSPMEILPMGYSFPLLQILPNSIFISLKLSSLKLDIVFYMQLTSAKQKEGITSVDLVARVSYQYIQYITVAYSVCSLSHSERKSTVELSPTSCKP